MKKLLIACAAVMTAAVAMATMSFAAYDYATGATEVSLDATATSAVAALDAQQLTVLVVKADSETKLLPSTISDTDILYIDQGAKGEISFENMKVISELADGDYVIAIGGEDIADGIIVDQFTVGTETVTPPATETTTVTWGNVNMKDGVDLDDANAILYYVLGTANTYEDYTVGTAVNSTVTWGNVNMKDGVDLDDANAILYYVLGTANTYGDYTVGQNAEITIN